MRGWLWWVTCLATVGAVSALQAKPPELPIRPLVEFREPLFPLGEEYAVPIPTRPKADATAGQLVREALDVMPRQIESLQVQPRPEPDATERSIGVELIESWVTRFAHTRRIPDEWFLICNQDLDFRLWNGPTTMSVLEGCGCLRKGMPRDVVIEILGLNHVIPQSFASSMQATSLYFIIGGQNALTLSFHRNGAGESLLHGFHFNVSLPNPDSVWKPLWKCNGLPCIAGESRSMFQLLLPAEHH